MDHMTLAIIGLALTTLGQIVSAVSWASRISTRLDNLTGVVEETKADVAKVREIVQEHETSIEVMKAVSHASNGKAHV